MLNTVIKYWLYEQLIFFLPSEMHFVDYYQIKKVKEQSKTAVLKDTIQTSTQKLNSRTGLTTFCQRKTEKERKFILQFSRSLQVKYHNSNFLVQMSGWWLCGEKNRYTIKLKLKVK